MKINMHFMVVVAALGLGLSIVACDDDAGDDTDANVSDGSADSNSSDVLVKLDTNKLDSGAAAKDGAGGDASSDAGGDTPTCSDYCDKITANCSGANAQYANRGDCMTACQTKLAWPTGTSEHTGNTLSCRDYHAGLAGMNAGAATIHCPHAGPTSAANMCGTLCENYCYLAAKNCTGAKALYEDNAACMTACAGTNNVGGFATTGMYGDTTGNTLQCRLYHVNLARDETRIAPVSANIHCPHAGVTPTAYCVAR